MARERLHGRKLHALRGVRHRFPFRPLCGVDAPAQVDEGLFPEKLIEKGWIASAW